MRALIVLLILWVSLLSNSYADFKNDLANYYAKNVNTMLFFTSEDSVSAGYYKFDDSQSILNTHFLPFIYQFESDNDFYNFYLNGSIGFSNFKEKNIDFTSISSRDSFKLSMYALKFGGGIRMNILKDADMMVGGDFMYARANSHFSPSKLLDKSIVKDKAIAALFNRNQTQYAYEFLTSLGYHPVVNAYQPYVRAQVRYFKTKIDTKYAIDADTTSVIGNLKVGVITPELTRMYGEPLTLEFYASEIVLSGDMDDILGCNNFFVTGMTFHLASPVEKEWIEEINLDMNLVRGDNFNGFNVGFGLSF